MTNTYTYNGVDITEALRIMGGTDLTTEEREIIYRADAAAAEARINARTNKGDTDHG